MTISICAIAKNENLYINDWCRYHLNGIANHIFIFDNNDPETEYVGNYISDDISSRVHIIPVNHFRQFQRQAYDDYYRSVGDKFDWHAFIDIDEYIVQQNVDMDTCVRNISDDVDVIRLNWQLFGDDGILYGDTNIPIYQRITTRLNHPYNFHAKSLVRGHLTNVSFKSVHYPLINSRMPTQSTPSGRLLPDSAKININCIDYSSIYLNHYMTKTWGEFIHQKLNRTDAALNRVVDWNYFFNINPNTKRRLKDNGIC